MRCTSCRNIMLDMAAVLMILAGMYSCQNDHGKSKASEASSLQGDLVIFHAGSLSAPLKEISRQFMEKYPDVKVLLEAAGSVDCARKITELHKPCDLMASSDYKVIEKLLIPGYTAWHIPFASNEMIIAFTGNSRRSLEIDSSNWFNILADPEVRYARSDPASDPCGYRTLMVMQLAMDHYHQPGLEKELAKKDTRYIRPKEVDLLALLEVGEIDYIFIYRSVAIQHHLKYIELPVDINLKDPAYSENYSKASVQIPGNQPGDTLLIYGEPMVYSITMLDNAPNRKAADAFLQFMLEPGEGIKVMEDMGQKSLIPAPNRYFNEIPEELRKFARP